MNNIPYINKNPMQNITNTNDTLNTFDASITNDTSNNNDVGNVNTTNITDITDKNLAFLQNNEHIGKYIKNFNSDNTENSKKKLRNKDIPSTNV